MKKIRLILILLMLASLLISCKSIEEEIIEDTSSVIDEEKKIQEEIIQLEEEVDKIGASLNMMNLEEKIGQLIIAGFEGKEINESAKLLISQYKVSGFILFARNIENAEQTKKLLNDLKDENASNQHALFLAIDEEGGRVSRLPSEYQKLPSALEVGNKGNKEIAQSLGRLLGLRVKSIGFNLNFAPILDIYSNPQNTVIGDRAFGKTAQVVIDSALNVAQAMRESGVIPVVKHFPGHGDTSIDSHLTLPKVEKNLQELKLFELKPFQAAIEEDIEMIMVAHILYRQIDSEKPATMSSKIIEDILRKDMGYEGVVVSDDMTMGAITEEFSLEEASLEFIKAGGDIALICHGEENTINTINRIKKAVEDGELSMEELDRKLYRILKLKEKYNLQDKKLEKLDLEEIKKETTEFLREFK